MVNPRQIGPKRTMTPTSAAERRFDGRAVVPGQEEIRRMEMFDATPSVNSRQEVITGDNSTFSFLRLARILLDRSEEGYAPVQVSLADEEALFYVNRGAARVTAGGETHELGWGDVIYVGIGQDVRIEADEHADVSEFRAVKCSTSHPVQVVRHAEIEGSPLAASLGTKRPMTKRTVFKLVDGSNIQACRLLFGDTYMSGPGAVGSYPPHFHGPDGPFGLGDNAKEEIYHFRVASDIPGDTGFVMQNCGRPGEDVGSYVHIFDEQAINVTPGFHDTMAPPSMEFMFTWCLASFTEGVRDWSVVMNKPGYDDEW